MKEVSFHVNVGGEEGMLCIWIQPLTLLRLCRMEVVSCLLHYVFILKTARLYCAQRGTESHYTLKVKSYWGTHEN